MRFDEIEIERILFGCKRKAQRFADRHSDDHYVYEVE
jgi:hypothetical protein